MKKKLSRILALLLIFAVAAAPLAGVSAFEYDTEAKAAYEAKLAEAEAHKAELEAAKAEAERDLAYDL